MKKTVAVSNLPKGINQVEFLSWRIVFIDHVNVVVQKDRMIQIPFRVVNKLTSI